MLNPSAIKKRANRAIDSYLNYAKSITKDGDEWLVQRVDTYRVNLENHTCTCKDSQFHGQDSPCKHLILVFLHKHNLLNTDTDESWEEENSGVIF